MNIGVLSFMLFGLSAQADNGDSLWNRGPINEPNPVEKGARVMADDNRVKYPAIPERPATVTKVLQNHSIEIKFDDGKKAIVSLRDVRRSMKCTREGNGETLCQGDSVYIRGWNHSLPGESVVLDIFEDGSDTLPTAILWLEGRGLMHKKARERTYPNSDDPAAEIDSLPSPRGTTCTWGNPQGILKKGTLVNEYPDPDKIGTVKRVYANGYVLVKFRGSLRAKIVGCDYLRVLPPTTDETPGALH